MPRGFGIGAGIARRFWRGGYGRGGYGRGFAGNPGPYCRFYPSRPRRWWAAGGNPNFAAPRVADRGFLQRQVEFLRSRLGELEKMLQQG